jgi:predicted nucleic acid-binding protein
VASEPFLDSNVLLYAIQLDDRRCSPARVLIKAGATVSVQVLNEFINVARKKFGLPYEAANEALLPIKASSRIVPLTRDTHERAMEMAIGAKLNIYDALIVAAAELAGCDVLFTEDLNHGQNFGSVTVRNPFI